MTGAHVTGGALGALLGAVLAPLLAKYGVRVTDTTASLIGTTALAFGVGLAHVVSTQGLWPALKRVFIGPPKPKPVVLTPAGIKALVGPPPASAPPPAAPPTT